MVKVNGILVFSIQDKKAILVAQSYNMTNYGYFYRGSAEEVARFAGREVMTHVATGSRGGVTRQEGTNVINIYYQTIKVPAPRDTKTSYSEGVLGCAVLTDGDYPKLVGISLVGKILSQFSSTVPFDTWINAKQDTDIPQAQTFMPQMLEKYQNPQEADDIEKIKKDLNETKDIIMESLDLLLKRGERLEDLIERSNDLSSTSKMFLTNSEKLNSCCILY